jgi:hypothetical protein
VAGIVADDIGSATLDLVIVIESSTAPAGVAAFVESAVSFSFSKSIAAVDIGSAALESAVVPSSSSLKSIVAVDGGTALD